MSTLRVELLSNMPYKSFAEIKAAIKDQKVWLGVDSGIALRWAKGGAKGGSQGKYILLVFFPHLTALAFIGFFVLTHSWWCILSLPLFPIGFFVLHPNIRKAFKPIHTMSMLLLISGGFVGLLAEINWLTLLTLCLAINSVATERLYQTAGVGLLDQALQHEDLFCALWKNRSMSLYQADGTIFSATNTIKNQRSS